VQTLKSWDGVYQPPLRDSFPEGHPIYAFSYVYDRTVDLGVVTEVDEDGYYLSTDLIKNTAERVCTDDPLKLPSDLQKALKDEPGLCLDLGFIYHLLATGYEIPGHRKLRTAKKIRDVETGWCLGASIAVLDSLMSGSKGSKGVCKL
jgi:guanosine-diphosphatase